MPNKTIKNLLAGAALLTTGLLNAQQWGDYTLYSVQNSLTTYLIDTANVTYHTWTHASGKGTGYSSYLTPGGTLVRTVKKTGNSFSGGGMCGEVMKVDYNGTVLWDYVVSSTTECSHHDICPMPNGNVLMIVYELKSSSQVTQAGCSSAITMWPDKIIEVQPTGATTGNIVWEWHLWDHLCQDYNSAKDNYVTNTNDHPELFDINSSITKEIWHMNGIDYNPVLDQIVVSAHNTDEFYVIDHSTTTAEAAGHTGGYGGRGGDFLYRWGYASNYGISGNNNFNVLHDAHWIPEGTPNEGRIVALNNKGISNTQSCIDQVMPPVVNYNYTYTPNTAWAPSAYNSRLNCNGGTTNMGNSQQLPNGNTMYCLALSGSMYETDPAGTTIWSKIASGSVAQAFRYSACHVNNAAPAIPTITQSINTLTSTSATTYQWYFNGVLMPGETNQSVNATQSGNYVVRVTDANGCTYSYSLTYEFQLSTGISEADPKVLKLFPNPTTGILQLDGTATGDDFNVFVYDTYGKLVTSVHNEIRIDLSEFANGIYQVVVENENIGRINRKIMLMK